MDNQRRQAIEQQIAELHAKAIQRPGPNDQAGMVGFGSALLAAQMQTWLLKADIENRRHADSEEKK